MTSAMTTEPAESKTLLGATQLNSLWNGFETWLARLVDRMNPILVKETRQALKSRQFVFTFLAVLICCWVASFAVVAISGPNIYYVAAGREMLWVYSAILAFPLLIIVPNAAFRSITTEREDNTYDLLSITTLTPGKIVTGKLGSAVVQMLVFLSAVSPCIAFTFLLRGVDALTVATLLGYYLLGSLGLSMLALLAGTTSKNRHSQSAQSVLLVIVCLGIYGMAMGLTGEFVRESYAVLRDVWFWIGNLAFLTFYVTTFALSHAAAAAQISFASENRSTPLRRIMFLQQACFLGWMATPVVTDGTQIAIEVIFGGAMVLGVYWYAMGVLLSSEWPILSRRVQRALPKSTLGRWLFTWFNPGPGTGYAFCVANVSFAALLGLGLALLFDPPIRWLEFEQLAYFLLLGWSYVVLYLGVGMLLIKFARRFLFVSFAAGGVLHVLLLLAGVGMPFVVSYLFFDARDLEQYSLIHMSNPVWTLMELIDHGTTSFDVVTTSLVLGSLAVGVLLLSVRTIAGEMRLERRALPERIVEEEAMLHPAPVPKPTSPWEESPAATDG